MKFKAGDRVRIKENSSYKGVWWSRDTCVKRNGYLGVISADDTCYQDKNDAGECEFWVNVSFGKMEFEWGFEINELELV